MPAIGEMQVYTGRGWVRLTSGPAPVDPETVGWPPAMPKPMKWEPADHGGPEPEDDPVLSELCEVLQCAQCHYELSADACGPQHAYLADHPAEHRLLKPLLAPYLQQLRFDEGRLCTVCTVEGGPDVVIATGDCKHADVRGDQVLVSRELWDALVDEVVGDRSAVAGAVAGAVDGLMDRIADQKEALGNGLIWHYEHREAGIAHLGVRKYWHDVAGGLLAGLTKRLEKT